MLNLAKLFKVIMQAVHTCDALSFIALTSQEYFIFYLLNVPVYICILSCNIFWQVDFAVLLFVQDATFYDLLHGLGGWSNLALGQFWITLKYSKLYKEKHVFQ